MNIVVIGTGYVGLVSGACFSEFGFTVTCVDKDGAKIAALEEGVIPIYEPGLEDLVKRNYSAGRLSFTTDLGLAVQAADAVFIAVGTPTRRGDGHADLSFVFAAAEEVAGHLNGYTVVVTKSTVLWAPANRLNRLSAPLIRLLILILLQILNSCAKALRLVISCGLTGLWWAFARTGLRM